MHPLSSTLLINFPLKGDTNARDSRFNLKYTGIYLRRKKVTYSVKGQADCDKLDVYDEIRFKRVTIESNIIHLCTNNSLFHRAPSHYQ